MANNQDNDTVATTGGDSHDLNDLLSSPARDFLVRNTGEQVKIESLKRKKLALYFSAFFSEHLTRKLVDLYNERFPKLVDFDVIFVSRNKNEESFQEDFSKMPWLAIPFSDKETRDRLYEAFEVRGRPRVVIIDENGRVRNQNAVKLIRYYGAEAYPYTAERMKELEDELKKARREQTLRSVLVTESRDFVISSDGNKVPVSELEGKTVALLFWFYVFQVGFPLTSELIEVYKKLKERGENFEVVLIPSGMEDEEEDFNWDFKAMPWYSLPFNDKICSKLDSHFRGLDPHTVIILGPDGKTLNSNVDEAIRDHGDLAYPFTPKKIAELEKAKAEAQTLESVLLYSDLNYVIGKDGAKVTVSVLEGKTVGLFFTYESYTPWNSFAPKLIEVYKKLKDQGKNFEIVLIHLGNEEVFMEDFKTMPWYALPFGCISTSKLVRYFKVSKFPTLVVLGPDGKTLNLNVVETIEDYGDFAYPFTPEKFVELEEIEKAKNEAQTLESILVSGDLNYVIGKDGTKVPVSDLVGKTILLYFPVQYCPPWCWLTLKLIEEYHKIKAKDQEFEVIFVSSDDFEVSFDECYSEMPWLALPFDDPRKSTLSKIFKVKGISMLVALGPSGKTLTKDARDLISVYGADAYPFTEERLKEIEEEMAKGWPKKVMHEAHEHEHELELTLFRRYSCDKCG